MSSSSSFFHSELFPSELELLSVMKTNGVHTTFGHSVERDSGILIMDHDWHTKNRGKEIPVEELERNLKINYRCNEIHTLWHIENGRRYIAHAFNISQRKTNAIAFEMGMDSLSHGKSVKVIKWP